MRYSSQLLCLASFYLCKINTLHIYLLDLRTMLIAVPPFQGLRIIANNNFSFFQVFTKSIYQLCNDLPSLRHATSSILHNFRDDGVRYLELRTTPRAVPDLNISKEQYVTTILDCIDEFRSSQGGKQSDMSVYLILSIDRSNSASEAMEVVDLAVRNRARGVVGVDLCGNPTKGDVSVFREAFAAAKRHGLKITLHFAETVYSGSRAELDTLLSYDPDRLGHVIHVPDDVKREIVRRKLGLELCMSCNVHAKLTNGGFSDHHFGYWMHQVCPLSLSVRGLSLLAGYGPVYVYIMQLQALTILSLRTATDR